MRVLTIRITARRDAASRVGSVPRGARTHQRLRPWLITSTVKPSVSAATKIWQFPSQRYWRVVARPQNDEGARLRAAVSEWVNCRHPRLEGGKTDRYSITSSASCCNCGGTLSPSALAVLRLITRSNLVGCSTGISAGGSPFKMRST